LRKKKKTDMTKFPCPKCGKYVKPFMFRKGDHKAVMECPSHGLFETDWKASRNFRLFCQKLGSKPNRSQGYYTAPEVRVKNYLDHFHLLEGVEYIHNCRIKNAERGVYYWVDYYLPFEQLIIEVSPSVWHKMWGREKSDKKKMEYLTKLGLTVINLDEKDLRLIDLRKKVKCEKLDRIFLSGKT